MSESDLPTGRALAPRRHDEIMRRLAADGSVGIAELASLFDVSRETVRRDLKLLSERGQLDIVHGGATRFEGSEPALNIRTRKNAAGKTAIGKKAAELVEDGMVVFLDSGTTTLAVAQALSTRQNLTICTSGLAIALSLCRQPGIRVHILGGEIDPREEASAGVDAIEAIGRFRVDIAFLGGGGLSPDGEVTDFSRAGAELRSRMTMLAGRAYFVLDSSKFGGLTPMRIPNFDQAAGVITDRAPKRALVRALEAKGPKLIVAGNSM